MKFHKQVDMILYNFKSMQFVVLFHADVVQNQLAILFNLFIVEYLVSILWHQYDMVGYLTVAMAKTVQFHVHHIPARYGWHQLWPWCQKRVHFTKEAMI